jgi:signal recognition particle GTPase
MTDSEKPKKGPSPTAKRQQQRRDERLKMIDEQVKEGSLVIRQMTPEERRKNPPQNRSGRKRK